MWLTTCTIWYKVFMNTKIFTNPWHPRRCGVKIYYASMTQRHTNWRWTTYLTLQSRFLWSNISHRKWNRSWSNTFGAVVNTSIAIHINTIFICKWPPHEERLKQIPKSFWIFVVFVMHQGCPSHILSILSKKCLYVLETSLFIGGKINTTSPSKDGGKYLTLRTSILW